mmetsp:Transcript_31786/g.75875  ORF Transcript_31786/g.75875 Transcript_31786/m.75875 type:complete len:214 (+) Transcript_31786:747-1388(+)
MRVVVEVEDECQVSRGVVSRVERVGYRRAGDGGEARLVNKAIRRGGYAVPVRGEGAVEPIRRFVRDSYGVERLGLDFKLVNPPETAVGFVVGTDGHLEDDLAWGRAAVVSRLQRPARVGRVIVQLDLDSYPLQSRGKGRPGRRTRRWGLRWRRRCHRKIVGEYVSAQRGPWYTLQVPRRRLAVLADLGPYPVVLRRNPRVHTGEVVVGARQSP